MNRYEAYALTSIAVDCDITQMVDIRKGVHCMVPKSIFANRKKKQMTMKK
jgi:acetamidase/formamidase